jgi:hypothetical protein
MRSSANHFLLVHEEYRDFRQEEYDRWVEWDGSNDSQC